MRFSGPRLWSFTYAWAGKARNGAYALRFYAERGAKREQQCRHKHQGQTPITNFVVTKMTGKIIEKLYKNYSKFR